jgi:Flp pilus assembly pilin Flp
LPEKKSIMKNLIRRFVSEEAGLESVEYAVLGSLIILAIIGAVLILGENVRDVFTGIGTEVGGLPTTQ